MDMDEHFKKQQEQREQAVTEHLAACERIRKKLELGPDALALVDRVLREMTRGPRGAWYDIVGPKGASPEAMPSTRAPLRLLSEKKIKPTNPITDKPTTLHVRPQTSAMRVEEIEILSNPDKWMVADIQVGNRSQFPQAGLPLSGRLFTPGGTCYRFVTETIQTAMDFTLLLHYVGDDPEGEIFEAVAMGSMARY